MAFELFLAEKGYILEKQIDQPHMSLTRIYKASLNTIGKEKLQIDKPIAIKLYCSSNLFITADEKIDAIRKYINTSAIELDYEKTVYSIVSKIPDLKNNIIKYISFERMHLTKAVFSTLSDIYIPPFLKEEDKKFAREQFRPDHFFLNMIITEYCSGHTLFHCLNAKKTPYEEDFILPILFQILWGIQQLQKHGIEHNDLHENNIFISMENNQIDRHYTTTNGIIFQLPQNSPRVLFFDWDLANMLLQNGPKASNPNLCREVGICGVLNERRDIHRALIDFISTRRDFLPPMAKKFIDSVLTGPVGKQKLNYRQVKDNFGRTNFSTSYPCNIKPGHPDQCLPYNNDEPQEIHDSTFLLMHESFQRYRVSTTLFQKVSNYFNFH